MGLYDINASNASSAASSSPFVNDAYLIVGDNPYVTGAGFAGGVTSTPTATSTATTALSSPGAGASPYGTTLGPSAPLSSMVGNLFSNTTFWLAAGAILTVVLIVKHRHAT